MRAGAKRKLFPHPLPLSGINHDPLPRAFFEENCTVTFLYCYFSPAEYHEGMGENFGTEKEVVAPGAQKEEGGTPEAPKAEPELPKENADYSDYVELGGKISKDDYERTLERLKNPTALSEEVRLKLRKQAEHIAQTAHIAPLDEEVILLYEILRTDLWPSDPDNTGIYKDHYTRMGGQELLAEALRMAGNAYSVTTLISAEESAHYQHYRELGGKLAQINFSRVLKEAKDRKMKAEAQEVSVPLSRIKTLATAEFIKQVGFIVENTGIELSEPHALDIRVLIFIILRTDPVPPDPETDPAKKGAFNEHYTRMSDQQLFAEALRIAEDVESLKKLMKKYTNTWKESRPPGDASDTKPKKDLPQAGIIQKPTTDRY